MTVVALAAGEEGQAAVELVALVPLVLVLGLAGAGILGARAAQERADDAARAGAMALLQGDDATAAARAVLRPDERLGVQVRGRRVTVAFRPRLPLHVPIGLVDVSAVADAGPEVRP